jgi:hypothetical protein
MGSRVVLVVLMWSLAGVPLFAQSTGNDAYYAVKPNPQLAAICAGEDGLTKVWDTEPQYQRNDVTFQWQGLKIQAEAVANGPAPEPGTLEASIPTTLPTFEQFRDAYLADRCKVARDGIRETFERAQPFFGFGWWECDVNWDQDCDVPRTIRTPPDFQICDISWRVAKNRGDSGFDVTPVGFMPNGANQTDRFNQYSVKLWAHGSGSTSGKGARIRIEQFVVTMIPRDWPDQARIKLGCKMPGRPAPATAPAPTPPSAPPLPSQFSDIKFDGNHSYRIQFYNPGAVVSRMEYLVERKDSDGSGWKQAAYGMIDVQPGTTWQSDGYHGWHAVNWQTRYAHIR